jgi:glycosyltransferase involved in cell wall biosynthesis
MTHSSLRPPAVSVVMPVFNVAPFVRSAADSVLKQTLDDLELIVVDDGSTDGSAEALAAVQDPRMRVIQQANAGSSAARNTGIQQAFGRYIAFIDGDDLWLPKKLSTHLEFMEQHPQVDLTFSLSSVVDEKGNPTGRASRRVKGFVSFQQLLIENVVANGSSVVLRRVALDRAGHFDVTLQSAVDHDVWLRVALGRPANVYCIPRVLTLYRLRAGQITGDWRRMEQSWRVLLEKMRRLAPIQVAAVERQTRAQFYRYLAYIAHEGGEYVESASLLRSALASDVARVLLDRRTWVLAASLLARSVLPAGTHQRLDRLARKLRSLKGRVKPEAVLPRQESGP